MALFARATTFTLQLLQLVVAAPMLLSDTSPPQSSSSSRCGNISLPYPFGVATGIYREGFKIVCNETYDPPKLFLGDTGVEVLEIRLQDGTIHIDGGILSMDMLTSYQNLRGFTTYQDWAVPLNHRLYTVSWSNQVVALGCGFDMLWVSPEGEGTAASTTCSSSCAAGHPAIATNGRCSTSGVGCCATLNLFGDYHEFRISYSMIDNVRYTNISTFVVVVDPECWSKQDNIVALQKAVSSHSAGLSTSEGRHSVPWIEVRTLVNWVFSNSSCARDKNTNDYGCLSSNSECHDSKIRSGYNCKCQSGFQGNPCIRDGQWRTQDLTKTRAKI